MHSLSAYRAGNRARLNDARRHQDILLAKEFHVYYYMQFCMQLERR
jgi:hypothetical protein